MGAILELTVHVVGRKSSMCSTEAISMKEKETRHRLHVALNAQARHFGVVKARKSEKTAVYAWKKQILMIMACSKSVRSAHAWSYHRVSWKLWCANRVRLRRWKSRRNKTREARSISSYVKVSSNARTAGYRWSLQSASRKCRLLKEKTKEAKHGSCQRSTSITASVACR